jgi:hypothetical protein
MSLRLGWEGAAADAESTTPGGRRTARFLSMWSVILVSALPGPGAAEDEAIADGRRTVRFLSMWAVILVSALPGPGAAEDEAPECGWLC